MRRLLLLLALLALLAGCAPAAPGPQPTVALAPTQARPTVDPASVVTITFGGIGRERQIFEPLIEAFNSANPDIQVQFVDINNLYKQSTPEIRSTRLVLRAVDTTYDNLTITEEDLNQGLVRDLRPLMEADPGFDQADFYPGTLAQSRIGEAMYMLPRVIIPPVFYYNKRLWNEAGLPPPNPNWPLSDMLDTAARLAHVKEGAVETYGIVEWNSTHVLFQEAANVGVDLRSARDETIRLDQPALVTALTNTAARARAGVYYNTVYGGSGEFDRMFTLMMQGQAGMFSLDLLALPPEEPRPYEMGLLLVPSNGIAPGTTRGYVMSGGTQHPEAAWRWLSFLSRKDVRGLISDTNDLAKFVIPARRSVAEGTNFWGRLDPEARAALEALIQQRATAQYPDLPGLYNNWWYQPLRDALSEVIEQKAPPEQALATAQATFEQQRNAWLARPTPTPDPQPFVVATPVPNVAAAGATRIKFGVTRSLENQVRAVAERFNQEQQAIFLELRIDSDSRSVSDMTSGNDCFAWPAPPTAADTAAVLDLQPLLDADPNLPGSDFPAPLLAPFQHAGGTFGLPLRVTVPTLGYNQALFTAGVATPTATWSPDDLLRAAQQLSSGSGEERRYGYASASGDLTAEVDFWLARFGASLSSGSGDGWKPTFTDPKTVAATRFIITLLRESSPHTALTGYSSATRFNDSRGSELIGAGRVALWLNQFNTGLPDSPTASYSPAIGPPPLGSEGFSPDDLEVSGLYIKVVTPHMQACWQWLKTLSNSLNQLEASPNRPLRLPARVALVALPADPATASVFNATRTAFERPARPRVLLPELNPYWFYRALDRALQGGDLEQELADAQFLTEQYLACVRGGEEAATCATQVDPTYDGFSQ